MNRDPRVSDGLSQRQSTPGVRSGVRRWSLPKLLAAALLFWIGWEVVSNTAADNAVAESLPNRALMWVRGHAAAQVELAKQLLASDDANASASAVADLARRSLRSDPLEADALQALAFALEIEGNVAGADTLMQAASSRDLRDLRAQTWLINRRLRDREFAEALRHIDAALRVWPDVADDFVPVLAGYAQDPEARDALIERLHMDPPWRSRFLRQLPRQSTSPASLYSLYSELKAGSAPPTTEEFRPYLLQLVEIGEYSLAYAMQVDFLPPERMGMLGHLNNGGFDHPISGLPFDWTIGSVRGARSEVVVDENSNRALRIEFHDTRVPYRHVSQLLLLRPGIYQLQGDVQPAGLRNERGMQWTISCVGEPEQLAQTERVSGSGPWTGFQVRFEVPDRDNCRAQEIRLVLAGRIAAEQQVAGSIWYDSLSIERVPEEKFAPRVDRADDND
jgi:tetratricopeptide (TPR) repeat protein